MAPEESVKIIRELKSALKDIYLDIANNYDVSDLRYDSDKVACVAGKFRRKASERIEKIIRKHMSDVPANSGWIPVEERLPEVGEEVLVQWEFYSRCDNMTYTYIHIMRLNKMTDEWNGAYGAPNGKVIAWRPLPEPYRPEKK